MNKNDLTQMIDDSNLSLKSARTIIELAYLKGQQLIIEDIRKILDSQPGYTISPIAKKRILEAIELRQGDK